MYLYLFVCHRLEGSTPQEDPIDKAILGSGHEHFGEEEVPWAMEGLVNHRVDGCPVASLYGFIWHFTPSLAFPG